MQFPTGDQQLIEFFSLLLCPENRSFSLIIISVWTDKLRNKTCFGSKVAWKLHQLVNIQVYIIRTPPGCSYIGLISLLLMSVLDITVKLFLKWLYIFFFAGLNWLVCHIPLGSVFHWMQCLKAWNHHEDLMQSCRIISGLWDPFPTIILTSFLELKCHWNMHEKRWKSY